VSDMLVCCYGGCAIAVTVPYIMETSRGDSDLSYDELLQLTTAASSRVNTSPGRPLKVTYYVSSCFVEKKKD